MPQLLSTMGPMTWLILFFATLAMAVVAERLFYFHRININSGDFLRGLSALLRSGQYDEALHEARLQPGPIARVIEAVLTRPRLARRELRDIAMEATEVEVYRVERNVRALVVCATVMPLLGLLGTMLALIEFYEQPGIISGGVSMPAVALTLQRALLLSAAGIALAIPTYLFYMYLSSRARKIINNIERAGLECVYIICDARMTRHSGESAPRKKLCRSGACSLESAPAAPSADETEEAEPEQA